MPPTEGPPSRDDESQRLTYKDLGVEKPDNNRPFDWNKDDPDLTDEKPYDQETNTGGKPVNSETSKDTGMAQVTSIEEYKAEKAAKASGPKPPPGPRGGTRLSA